MSSTAGGSSSDNEKKIQEEKKRKTSLLEAQPFLTYDLTGVVDFIDSRDPRKIIVMQGAGISVAAGIPDFRTPGTGLYSQVEKYKLPTPESLFTLDYLKENPEAFFRISKELNLWPGAYAPTHVHHLVKLLQDQGRLLRCYTQNIDCLERAAGIDPSLLVEAHGTFSSAHCINCKAEADVTKIRQTMEGGNIPHCDKCGGIVKPDVVFFGENLPARFFACLKKDVEQCDLLIVIGTSLAVFPFAGIAELVDDKCPRVLINNNRVGNFKLPPPGFKGVTQLKQEREEAVAKKKAEKEEKSGEVDDLGDQLDEVLRVTGSEDDEGGDLPVYRDVFLSGDCQLVARQIAQGLGLEKEMSEAYEAGKAKVAAMAKLD